MFLNSQNQYKKYAIDSILKEISKTHQTEWGVVCVCVWQARGGMLFSGLQLEGIWLAPIITIVMMRITTGGIELSSVDSRYD